VGDGIPLAQSTAIYDETAVAFAWRVAQTPRDLQGLQPLFDPDAMVF